MVNLFRMDFQPIVRPVGSVVIYDWAGGPLDPSIRGHEPG